jgi:hypothetical protein
VPVFSRAAASSTFMARIQQSSLLAAAYDMDKENQWWILDKLEKDMYAEIQCKVPLEDCLRVMEALHI